MSQPTIFDGFITPDGDLISIENVDGMISFLTKRTENMNEILQALWALAGECAEAGYLNAAIRYCEKLLALVDTPAKKAEVLLTMGQMAKRASRHRAVVDHQKM